MAVYNGKEISADKLKEKIVNVKGNRFIYGYDNGNRTEFLKSIEEANLITEKDTPIVIYSDSWGLPPIDSEIEDHDYTPVDLDGSYKAYCKKMGAWYYGTWLGE